MLVILIAAIVIKEVAILLLVVIIGMFFIFWLGVRSQKGLIRHYAGIEGAVRDNTVRLLSELNEPKKQAIIKALRAAAEDVANALNMPINLVRSNLFGVDAQNRMRMLRELTFQMERQEELTISMPVGYGSTGRCFKSRQPNIAVFRGGWGKDIIEDEELRKVHPELQWIISVPVLAGGEELRAVWVLNVDGLKERRGEDDLKIALGRLFHWSQMISLIMAIK